MDITLLNNASIRIKGKNAVLITEPKQVSAKTSADLTLSFIAGDTFVNSKIEGVRLNAAGAGEYEVLGAKIVGIAHEGRMVYSVKLDGLSFLIGANKTVDKLKEKLSDKNNVLILSVDEKFDEETITALAPQVVILFGDGASQAAKTLGSQASSISKYSVTAEKLPEEMEVVVL